MEISPYECCICGYIKTLSSDYTFSLYSIPEKSDYLANAWQKATGINKNKFLLGAKVCSRHFFDCDISSTVATNVRLNNNAIPSNNLEIIISGSNEEQMQEEHSKMDNSDLLINPSSNQDTQILTYQDQNSEKPKQFNDIFVDFLKSNSIHHSETIQKVVTNTSIFTQTVNTTQDESSRIDYHDQPSTSKQLFNYIKPKTHTQSGYKMHYYDIDPLPFDNQEQGVIKRPRPN